MPAGVKPQESSSPTELHVRSCPEISHDLNGNQYQRQLDADAVLMSKIEQHSGVGKILNGQAAVVEQGDVIRRGAPWAPRRLARCPGQVTP